MILATSLGVLPLVLLPTICLLLSGRALSEDDNYCDGLSSDSRVVSTATEATALGEDLGLCPGLEFNIYWRGAILLDAGAAAPLELTNSTTLRVSGDGTQTSLVDGGGQVTLFVVSELSVLHLEGLGLTGGYGENGGAVAAVEGASVTLVDCDVNGNRASSNGGRCVCVCLFCVVCSLRERARLN